MKRKSKSAEEATAREQQRAELRDAKARRQQPADYARVAPTLRERPILLIVCQGTRTEVDYFEHFELATATIKAEPYHRDPEGVVAYALGLRDRARLAGRPYEQVWCVFDKDESTPQQIHDAMTRARQERIHVALSNQSFEYWLLLHFLPHHGEGLNRHVCTTRLMELIEAADPTVWYDGFNSKRISRELFDLLEAHVPVGPGRKGLHPRRKVAIGRARKIATEWQRKGPPPADQESSTGVYKLVLLLQKHLPTQ